MKIVINKCYGGFSLSEEAYKFMGIERDEYGMTYRDYDDKKNRTNEKLIECVETLGERANGMFADLRVVEVELSEGEEWFISKYDGMEEVITFKPSKSLPQVLDEIRAEIEQLRPNLRPEQMTDYDYAMVDAINGIVAIFDKYKTESEE